MGNMKTKVSLDDHEGISEQKLFSTNMTFDYSSYLPCLKKEEGPLH